MYGFLSIRSPLAALMLILSTGIATDTVSADDAPRRAVGSSSDWVFLPGPFSHDPMTGRRVAQFAPTEPSQRNPNAWFESPGQSTFHATMIQQSNGPYDPYPRQTTRIYYHRNQHAGYYGYYGYHGYHGYWH